MRQAVAEARRAEPRAPRRRVLAAVVAAAALLPATPARTQDGLPDAVRAALSRAGVEARALGAVALPLGHRGRAWRHRAAVPMQPASTMKLLTSIVALDRLGPNHRGYTALRSAAAVQGGVLRGDLVLEGGADPELGTAQFWELLMQLRALGIERITGDLIVDRTLFRPARMDLGVPPFDEAPEWGYNVIPDALHLAGSLLAFDITSVDGTVRARGVPPLPGIEFTSTMGESARACADWDDDWKPARVTVHDGRTRIELRGAFPKDCTARAELQLIDRQQLTEALFRTLWAGLGGRFDGRVREAAEPLAGAVTAAAPAAPGARVLVRRQARPWGELLRPMNKRSDNPLARLLYLSLGLRAAAAPPGAGPSASTAELAAREVRAWLAEQRIDAPGLVLDNGSGLSRSERIAPLTLARMLEAAWRGRWASELTMSLPLVGSETALALADTPAAARSRMKGGTLRDVSALAGYVVDAAGRPWVLVAFVNHERAHQARPALHALVDELARHGSLHARQAEVGPQGEGP
jgi:D-alanyl-D-alanine carboxypeptidase/D-alanyl-D-alanine-endopeptidase (penicillin-binding protein 4)